MKILYQGREAEIRDHPCISLPFCPNCGKKLSCLWFDGIPLAMTIDFILFCQGCEHFWYSNGAYFQLKKIRAKDWGIEIKRH